MTISQPAAQSRANAPIQRAASESTWTTTRSRAGGLAARSTGPFTLTSRCDQSNWAGESPPLAPNTRLISTYARSRPCLTEIGTFAGEYPVTCLSARGRKVFQQAFLHHRGDDLAGVVEKVPGAEPARIRGHRRRRRVQHPVVEVDLPVKPHGMVGGRREDPVITPRQAVGGEDRAQHRGVRGVDHG